MSDRLYNILVINWQDITHPLGGGAEVHFHEIFKRVVAAGHSVTLLCCNYDNAADVEIIDGIRIIRRGTRDFFNFYVPGAYRKLAANEKFDIVFDDLNKIPFYTPWFVKEPLVALAHHFFGKSIFMEVSFQYASYVALSESLIKYVYRNTPFAVVSESTRQEVKSWGVKSEIDLLPNAVDLAKYYFAPEEKSTRPTIGYLGRIKKYKSVDHIIKAMPHILERQPNALLKIVCGGDALDNLKELATSLNISEHVEFTGHVSHEEKVRLINESWLVVNPSSKEGWGLTVIEANACHVPVVAANSPGLRDSVVDGKTGLLYEYGNIEQLASSVVGLLKDENKRQEFAVASREWAEQWSWSESAKKAINIIEKQVS